MPLPGEIESLLVIGQRGFAVAVIGEINADFEKEMFQTGGRRLAACCPLRPHSSDRDRCDHCPLHPPICLTEMLGQCVNRSR